MGKILTLHLEKRWFDMIKKGEKKEEYRDITDYWIKRLVLYECKICSPNNKKCYIYKDFYKIVFVCGYAKNSDEERRLIYNFKSIKIDIGNNDWGASGKKQFIIEWEPAK